MGESVELALLGRICELAYCLLQVNKTIPYRPADKSVVAATKDMLITPCVAGQLGATAEPTGCDVRGGSCAFELQPFSACVVVLALAARCRTLNLVLSGAASTCTILCAVLLSLVCDSAADRLCNHFSRCVSVLLQLATAHAPIRSAQS